MASADAPRTPRTREEAMRGVRGVDYFPDDYCTVCGAVVWYDGLRYQMEHDAEKHRIAGESGEGVDARRRSQPEQVKDMASRFADRARTVRRSFGDDDDE